MSENASILKDHKFRVTCRDQYLLSSAVRKTWNGWALGLLSPSDSPNNWARSLKACPSPEAALLTCCWIAASSLLIFFLFPFSVTVTWAKAALLILSRRLNEPLRRPRGLPDFPSLKRLCSGGCL